MSSINISRLKYTWKGPWTSGIRYYKNDVAQWNGSSYVCIQDLPDEFKISTDTLINTSTYHSAQPEIVFVDRRPDNVAYWKLIVRGNTFKHGWMPHRVYQVGDIVRYAGDLFMYTGAPGFGATATAIVSNGQLAAINVTNGGTGYTTPPAITIAPANSSLFASVGAQAYALVSSGVITSIKVSSPGVGYSEAPLVIINPYPVRNTHPDDTTYWTKIFENTSYDSRRMYAVATPNMQPLGWTRNNGDFPNPQICHGHSVGFIDALGVPYTIGANGTANNNAGASSYQTGGRGIKNQWVVSWQPAGFTFVDWLRSTDCQTALGISVAAGLGLPTPDGKPPRCIQWIYTQFTSYWLFNNGEVYTCGYNNYGQLGINTTANSDYPVRSTNQSTVGWLSDALPKSFNQTKIIKIDIPNTGGQDSAHSVFAIGNDGSVWAWGYNAYGQLGLGQQVPGTTNNGLTQQTVPTRIPGSFFDWKKIVDIVSFGNNVTSVLAVDEDGDLWGWGSNIYGELGLGTIPGTTDYIEKPTKIPFDFKRFGGIKKISYYHYGTTTRAAFILTNDGSLFGAGYFYTETNPLNQNYSTTQSVPRWTKYNTTGFGVKAIENFWLVGDGTFNIYIREKDTGLTYAMGDNTYRTLGSSSSSNYGSAGTVGNTQTSGWVFVKGPKNIVHVTNNSADNSVASGYITVVLIDEAGRGWGQGWNSFGSLSIGYTGVASEFASQQPDSPDYGFAPIKVPAGAKLGTAMGCGFQSYDLGSYITNDGQLLYCGTDNSVYRNGGAANTYGGLGGMQGNAAGYWSLQAINTVNNQYPNDRYTMHSQPGD